MLIIHISDLHFGKSVHGLSMIEDQTVWVDGFIAKVNELKPDAIVIAGDVYDRTQPSDEAVRLFDRFIAELSRTDIPVMIVAGNHDSARKLSVHSALLAAHNIHIAGVVEKTLKKVTLTDAYGDVDFYLMPYITPLTVRLALGDDSIHDFSSAASKLLDAQSIDHTRRTVLIAHQNVTANGEEAEAGGSETNIGGISGIDYSVFDGFDYVALGHIHGDASMGRKGVRYAGTPMSYHFNETRQKVKGALAVTIVADGSFSTEKIAIPVKHRMVELRDTFENILTAMRLAPEHTWFKAVLTDRLDGIDEVNAMRNVLALRDDRLLLEHDSDLNHTEASASIAGAVNARARGLSELFNEFYTSKSGAAPSDNDAELFDCVESVLNDLYGDKADPDAKAVDRIVQFMLRQEENAQ